LFLCLALAGGILALITAYLLWRKNNYWLTMGGLILCCVPINPLTVLSLVFGIWGLAVIDQPTAREVFHGPKRRFGISQLLLALVFFIPLILMMVTLWVYSRSAEYPPEPKSTTVGATVESSADDEPTRVAAEDNVAGQAEAESENSSTAVSGASTAEAADAADGYNNPSQTTSDPNASSFSPNYKLGFMLIAGLIVSISFVMILALVLYLVLRKPQRI
jgi:ABC-type multidrug transport system fused ATPase/permease subunit